MGTEEIQSRYRSSLRDLGKSRLHNPTLKRWAIITGSLRDAKLQIAFPKGTTGPPRRRSAPWRAGRRIFWDDRTKIRVGNRCNSRVGQTKDLVFVPKSFTTDFADDTDQKNFF